MLHILAGHDLTAEEIETNAKVALLCDRLADEVFGDRNPVGQTILLDSTVFHVVGLYSSTLPS